MQRRHFVLFVFNFFFWTLAGRPLVPSICSKNYNPFSSVTTSHPSCPIFFLAGASPAKAKQCGRNTLARQMKLAAQLEGRQLKRVICGQALLTAYLGGVDREQHSVGVVWGGGGHSMAWGATLSMGEGHTHLITNHQWPSLLAATLPSWPAVTNDKNTQWTEGKHLHHSIAFPFPFKIVF